MTAQIGTRQSHSTLAREEKELIERFGDGYSDYRKRVPALLVRPSRFKEYLRFLKETL